MKVTSSVSELTEGHGNRTIKKGEALRPPLFYSVVQSQLATSELPPDVAGSLSEVQHQGRQLRRLKYVVANMSKSGGFKFSKTDGAIRI